MTGKSLFSVSLRKCQPEQIPSHDHLLLVELLRYELLDTSYETEFNDVDEMTATICKTAFFHHYS